MESNYKILYNPLAQSDINDIADYIANILYAPVAMQTLLSKFHNAIENLKYFPFSGKSLSKNTRLKFDYRWIMVERYMIFYYVNQTEQNITIARILYAASDYFKKL